MSIMNSHNLILKEQLDMIKFNKDAKNNNNGNSEYILSKKPNNNIINLNKTTNLRAKIFSVFSHESQNNENIEYENNKNFSKIKENFDKISCYLSAIDIVKLLNVNKAFRHYLQYFSEQKFQYIFFLMNDFFNSFECKINFELLIMNSQIVFNSLFKNFLNIIKETKMKTLIEDTYKKEFEDVLTLVIYKRYIYPCLLSSNHSGIIKISLSNLKIKNSLLLNSFYAGINLAISKKLINKLTLDLSNNKIDNVDYLFYLLHINAYNKEQNDIDEISINKNDKNYVSVENSKNTETKESEIEEYIQKTKNDLIIPMRKINLNDSLLSNDSKDSESNIKTNETIRVNLNNVCSNNSILKTYDLKSIELNFSDNNIKNLDLTSLMHYSKIEVQEDNESANFFKKIFDMMEEEKENELKNRHRHKHNNDDIQQTLSLEEIFQSHLNLDNFKDLIDFQNFNNPKKYDKSLLIKSLINIKKSQKPKCVKISKQTSIIKLDINVSNNPISKFSLFESKFSSYIEFLNLICANISYQIEKFTFNPKYDNINESIKKGSLDNNINLLNKKSSQIQIYDSTDIITKNLDDCLAIKIKFGNIFSDIRILNLSNTRLSNENQSCFKLFDWIKDYNLEKLNLTNCLLDDSFVNHLDLLLLSSAKEKKKIKFKVLRKKTHSTTLKSIILNDNFITEIGFNHIVESIIVSQKIEELGISNNHLKTIKDKNDPHTIGKIIDNFVFKYYKIKIFDLSFNNLNDQDILDFTTGFNYNKSIVSLNLCGNKFSSKGILYLKKCLMYNSFLKELYIGNIDSSLDVEINKISIKSVFIDEIKKINDKNFVIISNPRLSLKLNNYNNSNNVNKSKFSNKKQISNSLKTEVNLNNKPDGFNSQYNNSLLKFQKSIKVKNFHLIKQNETSNGNFHKERNIFPNIETDNKIKIKQGVKVNFLDKKNEPSKILTNNIEKNLNNNSNNHTSDLKNVNTNLNQKLTFMKKMTLKRSNTKNLNVKTNENNEANNKENQFLEFIKNENLILNPIFSTLSKLNIISLENCNLTGNDIIPVLKNCKDVLKLSFKGNKLDTKSIYLMEDCIINNFNIKELNLSENKLCNVAVNLLCEYLNKNSTIVSIDLSYNEYDQNSMLNFNNIIYYHKSINKISFEGNNIGTCGVKHLLSNPFLLIDEEKVNFDLKKQRSSLINISRMNTAININTYKSRLSMIDINTNSKNANIAKRYSINPDLLFYNENEGIKNKLSEMTKKNFVTNINISNCNLKHESIVYILEYINYLDDNENYVNELKSKHSNNSNFMNYINNFKLKMNEVNINVKNNNFSTLILPYLKRINLSYTLMNIISLNFNSFD